MPQHFTAGQRQTSIRGQTPDVNPFRVTPDVRVPVDPFKFEGGVFSGAPLVDTFANPFGATPDVRVPPGGGLRRLSGNDFSARLRNLQGLDPNAPTGPVAISDPGARPGPITTNTTAGLPQRLQGTTATIAALSTQETQALRSVFGSISPDTSPEDFATSVQEALPILRVLAAKGVISSEVFAALRTIVAQVFGSSGEII